MRRVIGFLACAVLLGTAVLPSQAQLQLGGLMRDEYALGLTPTIKSAGMGGAYVGVEGTQSMNPAALSIVDYMEAALTYGNYDHDDGPMAHRGRLDATLPVPYIGGAARLMLDRVDSESDDMTLLGAPIEFDASTLGLQYGRNITDWWAVGIGGYPYEKANVDMITPGGTIDADALSQIGSFQAGTLFRPHEQVSIGAQLIYIIDELEADVPGAGEWNDDYYISYVSLGASYRPFEGTLLAVDYWNGEIRGDQAPGVELGDDTDVDRWNIGIQQRMCSYFDLRVGANNGGFTTGFSIHVLENLDIDYAYVNQALRDKEMVFGDTQYHGLSVTYRF